jgi:hypothetical protein
MGDSLNQCMLFQQNEHRPNRAGIRRHAAGEFPLGERLSPCERCEENELVGCDAMGRELRLRPAMECHICRTERHWQFVFGRHLCLFEGIRAYTHVFESLPRQPVEYKDLKQRHATVVISVDDVPKLCTAECRSRCGGVEHIQSLSCGLVSRF